MKSKYFTTGYIYIYSIAVVLLDSFTLSRDDKNLLDFEVFSLRLVGLFTFWLVIKNLSSIAEKRGHSYKSAMILLIIGLPVLAGLLSLLLLQIS